MELVLQFLRTNASDVLSFAAPFPELRAYFEWIINHFDAVDSLAKKDKNTK
jgi:hypothetical protein